MKLKLTESGMAFVSSTFNDQLIYWCNKGGIVPESLVSQSFGVHSNDFRVLVLKIEKARRISRTWIEVDTTQLDARTYIIDPAQWQVYVKKLCKNQRGCNALIVRDGDGSPVITYVNKEERLKRFKK